jgi:oligopeptide/dipeptide ABC transporter ATP-binding protein
VKLYPHELSGGMAQRVMIAMAISCRPRLLLADEPTTALDVTVQVQILDLLKGLCDQLGMGLLLISHDLGVVAHVAGSISVMYAGQVVEQGTIADLLAGPGHPYVEGLLRSWPDPALKGRDLPAIGGSPPRFDELPSGCRFHPRCGYAVETCAAADVPLEPVQPGRRVRCVRFGELALTGFPGAEAVDAER